MKLFAAAACGFLCVLIPARARAEADSSPLTPQEQERILTLVRQQALRHQQELQDFVCIQLTTRSVDETGTGKHWKQKDLLEVEDIEVGPLVNHKLLMRNRKAPDKTYQQLTGILSETVLHSVGFLPKWIFGPEAKAEVEWSHSGSIDGRRMYVFSVRVRPSDSKFLISTGRESIIAGVNGMLYADAVTGAVKRFEIQMELPPESILQNGFVDIDYDNVEISGETFILPVKSEVRARIGKTLEKNETQVLRYQKYGAKTSIRFD